MINKNGLLDMVGIYSNYPDQETQNEFLESEAAYIQRESNIPLNFASHYGRFVITNEDGTNIE